MPETRTQIITLEGDDEVVIPIPGYDNATVVVTRSRGDRKKLIITMPTWMKAWKGREKVRIEQVVFRVIS